SASDIYPWPAYGSPIQYPKNPLRNAPQTIPPRAIWPRISPVWHEQIRNRWLVEVRRVFRNRSNAASENGGGPSGGVASHGRRKVRLARRNRRYSSRSDGRG